MSGLDLRPPLRGVIYQGNSIVGGVVLNGPDEAFIQEFNREYGKLGLRVAAQEISPCSSDADRLEAYPTGDE
jgi:hypothetical protein